MNAMQMITRIEGKSRNIFVYADSGRVCWGTVIVLCDNRNHDEKDYHYCGNIL